MSNHFILVTALGINPDHSDPYETAVGMGLTVTEEIVDENPSEEIIGIVSPLFGGGGVWTPRSERKRKKRFTAECTINGKRIQTVVETYDLSISVKNVRVVLEHDEEQTPKLILNFVNVK